MSSTINATTVGVGGIVATADNSGILILQTASTTALTISAAQGVTLAGTLGVTGATTLSTTLGVTGATTLSTTLGVTGAATLSSTLAVTGITTVAAGSAAAPSIVSTTGTADTGQFFPAADTVAFSTAGTERIRITSGGLFGIGCTPARQLSVQYDFAKTDTTSRAIAVFKSNDASNANEMLISSTGAATQASRVWSIQTGEDGVSNAGIIALQAAGGFVGIGTTSTDKQLHVKRSATGFAAKIENNINSASSHGLMIDFGDGTPSAGAIAIQFFRISSATAIGSITQSGDNIVYNTSSDRRLKENISPTIYGLSDLMKIPVNDFNFITSPARRSQGFIAQDLYKVYPFAVTTNGDGGVDPISADATMGWQVDYSRITPLLVSAIQELKAIIDTQAARITALETL